jgi:dephospho-CoA kinase
MTAIKLALTGKLRAGKSHLANYATLFYDFQPFAFGNALKDAYHRAFPFVPREPKPRRAYQLFGQLARELIDENVWVDATMRKVNDYIAQHVCACGCACGKSSARVLIEDCRQQNEFDRLRAEGFVIVRVTAPDELRIERARKAGDDFTEADLRHETELLVDTFAVDYEIWNYGSLSELEAQFDGIMWKLGVEKR